MRASTRDERACSSRRDPCSPSQSARDARVGCLQFVSSQHANQRTKGPDMKAISTQVRLTSLLLAVLMSATVLGATVAGMQSSGAASHDVVVLEHVTVRPTAVQ
jgi:hypothetical protein